jgi:type III secretion system YscQ/HrcQ family protein
MDMHHIDPMGIKNRTDPVVGFLCHRLPGKVCEINPLPDPLPVNPHMKSSTSRKVAGPFGAGVRRPGILPRPFADHRQKRVPSEPIVQLEDNRHDIEPLLRDALTAIDGWSVPFLNTIYGANSTVAFNLDKAEYTFVFEPEAEHAQPVKYAPEIVVTLVANSQRFSIGLEHLSFIDALDGVHTQKLPEQIQCAFFEAWLSSIFEKLEQWRGARINVDSLKWRPDILENEGYNLYFSLSRLSDKLETKGHVSMDRVAMQWLAEGYAKEINNGNFTGADQFPFELCVEIGWTQIGSQEFSRLESNDILLLDRSTYYDREKRALVRLAHGPCWVGNIEGDIIIITAIWEIPMGNQVNSAGKQSTTKTKADPQSNVDGSANNANKTSKNQGQEDLLAAALKDGLNINLVFELGRRKVTLGELKKIKPGYTFDLATQLDRCVSVVANGRTVGKGNLVQIDQRLGVRLVEIIR